METKATEQKKPYSPPTVTEQGDVVERTKGCYGRWCELDGPLFIEPDGML